MELKKRLSIANFDGAVAVHARLTSSCCAYYVCAPFLCFKFKKTNFHALVPITMIGVGVCAFPVILRLEIL